MENSRHKSPHLCPSLCTNYACRLGRAGHTVSNTTPVDNSTVAAGSLVVQPSFMPPFVSCESWCLLRSKKHAANEHNYFHPYRPRKQGPPRNDGTESSPDGVSWNARRVGALVLPSAVELAKLALGYGLLGCCGCVRTPARPLN